MVISITDPYCKFCQIRRLEFEKLSYVTLGSMEASGTFGQNHPIAIFEDDVGGKMIRSHEVVLNRVCPKVVPGNLRD